QASAGLDALTDAERAEFERLNARYTAAYGHPFIIAVRDHDKAGIMAAFQRRLGNSRAQEFAEACAQVVRIAELRLREMLPDRPPPGRRSPRVVEAFSADPPDDGIGWTAGPEDRE
ncbi:MAG TPA: 2-oxo-4-hydroxy-4-carboxy-5-ureidoimidazoline decarboxylase, partial [Paracoccaceae bacterium]|nr:2-oxo-4-hydroxy-4-carboxy-5-ureidoimidazoline decarboxylase [Paracoccaceae bacterium]